MKWLRKTSICKIFAFFNILYGMYYIVFCPPVNPGMYGISLLILGVAFYELDSKRGDSHDQS